MPKKHLDKAGLKRDISGCQMEGRPEDIIAMSIAEGKWR